MMHLASHWARAGTLLFICLSLAGIHPADAQTKEFNLPAQPAIKGIPEFARQAGIQILVSEKLVRDKRTAAITGPHSIAEGLTLLFKGTGLAATSNDGSTYTVAAAPQPKTTDESTPFNIPAEDLTVALSDFSTQSGLKITVTRELTAGKKSQGARGTMKAAEALRRVLKGSGLKFVVGGDGAFAISANASEGPSQEKADTADVTVEGQQEKEKPFTGSNVDIPRTINDVQPYYIFDAQTIEMSGATNIEDFLKKQLTMNTVAQTNSQAIGYKTGVGGANILNGNTSTINLRGLGTSETLVLVNGRRMAGVNIQNGTLTTQPDINGLPLAAIERIEILPSSASGIYGGSAVGGVVNIILKRNYSGGDVKATYDSTWDGHAPARTLDATYGTGFEGGRSHFMVTASYSDSKPLYVGDRAELIQRGYTTLLKNDPGFLGFDSTPGALNTPLLGATPNIIGIYCDPNTGNCGPANLTLKSTGASLNSAIATLPVGYSLTSNPSTIIGGRWNLALPRVNDPPNGLLTPLGSNTKTESLLINFSRRMTDALEVFAESMLSSNKSFQNVGQFANSAGTSFFVPSTSPVNPFNQDVWITFPDNHSAPVTSNSVVYSITTGLKADLPFGWNSEVDYTWSKSRFDQNSVYQDGVAWDAAVNNGLINPFVDTVAHPLDLSKYFAPQPYSGSSTLNDVALRASGPLARWSWGDPTLALGLEHRKEDQPGATTESIFPLDLLQAQKFIYFPQSQSTNSVYAEGSIPLVTSKNALPGLKLLELQLTDRVEQYSVNAGSTSENEYPYQVPLTYYINPTPPDANPDGSGGTLQYARTTYTSNDQTFGLKYKPLGDVMIRASLGTAFLPPQYNQLFPRLAVCSLCDTITDPKTGSTYQVNTRYGGNQSLKPQHSKNWDLGLIYEPEEGVLKGLRVDLEYYQIAQFGYITQLSGNQILNDPGLASRITRDSTTGLVTLIDESLINATEFKTEGWDLALEYRIPTDIGAFALRGAATRIDHNKQVLTPGQAALDFAGAPLKNGGQPKLKANGSLNWAYRRWVLNWNVTWFGRYPVAGSAADLYDPNDQTLLMPQGADHIPSQIYHDFFASYSFSGGSHSAHSSWGSSFTDGLRIQIGINNVFNRIPAFEAYNAPFYVSPFGDLRLRDYRLSVVKEF